MVFSRKNHKTNGVVLAAIYQITSIIYTLWKIDITDKDLLLFISFHCILFTFNCILFSVWFWLYYGKFVPWFDVKFNAWLTKKFGTEEEDKL